MKRLSVILSLVMLCLVADVRSDDQQQGFSGTWVQDVKNSDPVPRMTGGGFGGPGMGGPGGGRMAKTPQASTQSVLTIRHENREVQMTNVISTNGVAGPAIVENFILDGEERLELVKGMNSDTTNKQTTSAKLKKNKVEIHIKTESTRFTTEMKKEYSLSKDGRRLTLKITTYGFMPTEQKLVYLRQ